MGSCEKPMIRIVRQFKVLPAFYKYPGHVIARKLLKTVVPGLIVRHFFKFSFVRNPWDLHVSFYHFILEHHHHWMYQRVMAAKSFEGYIELGLHKLHPLQSEFVTDTNGKVIVDFIGRYENIQEDFNKICGAIGIPMDHLPHRNQSVHRHYREYYSERTKKILYRDLRKDVELFNYDF